jgi:hypothetical protein
VLLQPLIQIALAAAAGFLSALCMTFFEIPFFRRWGTGGVAEWQVNSAIVSLILYPKSSQKRAGTVSSVMMHLLHGALLGIIFLFIILLIPENIAFSSLLGIAVTYSMLLWVISPTATRGFFESIGKFRITGRGLVVSFFSHIIYGFFLGLIFAIVLK